MSNADMVTLLIAIFMAPHFKESWARLVVALLLLGIVVLGCAGVAGAADELSVPMLRPGPRVDCVQTSDGTGNIECHVAKRKPRERRERHCFDVNCRTLETNAPCLMCPPEGGEDWWCSGSPGSLSCMGAKKLRVCDRFCVRGKLEVAK